MEVLMDLFHVSFPGLGIYDLQVNRIAFSFEIGGTEINIYWYGILIAIAFLIGIVLAVRQAPQFGLKGDDVIDILLWVIILSLVGARLYYVIFSWEDFSGNLLKIFQTRDGGLAFYGGVIGGVLGVFIGSKLKKINLMYLLDFFAVYLPLGQAIGRWGNFFNQEAFGTNTILPWGMFSEGTYQHLANLGEGYAPLTPVHPTFLYESIANIIIFVILYHIRSKSKESKETGRVTGFYFVLYGLVRFFVEGLRTDSLYIGQTSIRVSQLLSLILVFVGIALIVLAKRNTFSKDIPVVVLDTDEEASQVEADTETEEATEEAIEEIKETETEALDVATEETENEEVTKETNKTQEDLLTSDQKVETESAEQNSANEDVK